MQHSTTMDLPIDTDVVFSIHKNIYKKGTEERQSKLLKKVPYIEQFLESDEKILLVTTACSPSPLLDQLITGWIFLYSSPVFRHC